MANIIITLGSDRTPSRLKWSNKVIEPLGAILQAVPNLFGEGLQFIPGAWVVPNGTWANFVPCSIYPWESQFTFGIMPYLIWCVEKYLLWIKKVKELRLNSSKKKTLSRIDHQRWMHNLILTIKKKKRTHSIWFSLIASTKIGCLFLLIHS